MIINIAHQKGGVGKSTLAINLGIEMKADSLDLDNQNSVLLFNKMRERNGYKPLSCFTLNDESELKNVFSKYKGLDKTLIVDSGGYDSTLNRLAMLLADYIITPVSPSQIELFGLQKFENVLREASKTFETDVKTNVVINNADVRSKSDILNLKSFVKNNDQYLTLMNTIIYSRKDYKRAYLEGLSVVELEKHSKAANEIQNLVKEIKKAI